MSGAGGGVGEGLGEDVDAGVNEGTPVVQRLTRGRRLARNSALNLLGQGLPMVVAVLVMPGVIAGLGEVRFGILALVWAAIAYLGVLDLGMGRATTRFVAEALAGGDDRRIAASARIAFATQLGLGALVALTVALGTRPLVALLNLPDAASAEAVGTFYFVALAAPVVLVTNTFRGVLEAAQRFDVINLVRAPVSTASFLVPWVGVLLGWSLVQIIAGLVVFRIAALLILAALALRHVPALRGPSRVDRADVALLVRFGGWITVSSVVSPLLVYLDRYVIGSMAAVAAVGFYAAPHEIVTRLGILPASLVATLFPAFSARAGGGSEQNEGLVGTSLKLLMLLAAPPLIAIAAFSGDLLHLWLGPGFAAESTLVLRILALGMILNAVAYIPAALLQANDRPDLTAKFHLVELPIHLVLLLFLVARWGIAGAALAWTIRAALDMMLLFVGAWRVRVLSAGGLMRSRVPHTVLLLSTLGLVVGLASALGQAAALRLALAAAAFLVAAAFAWLGLLTSSERASLLSAARPSPIA